MEAVWKEVDPSGNDSLNKQKTMNLVRQVIENLQKKFPDFPKFSRDNYDETFREYRGDGTDNIKKKEMVVFIR